MCFVEIEGERVGLIAGERSPFLGHDGIYFHEIFVSQKWKGKGLAKIIQRKYVDQFTEGHEFVWGTIDHFNLPSFKTAEGNGRKAVRFENFVEID